MPLPTDPFVKTQVFKSWFKNLDSGLENGKMVKSHFFFAGNVLLKNFLFIWLHHVLVVACGIYFPNQGLNPGPLCWEYSVLATGPSGKSPKS